MLTVKYPPHLVLNEFYNGDHAVHKFPRRSSLFRPNVTKDLKEDNTNYPTNYIERLIQENVQWLCVFDELKQEILTLQSTEYQNKKDLQPDFTEFKKLLKEAEDVCSLINNTNKLKDNLMKCHKHKNKQLEMLISSCKQIESNF